MGQRGQPLHMGTEHLGEHGGFGFAELGEFGGHMSHRAVVLTDLDADSAAGNIIDRCRESLSSEQLRQRCGSLSDGYGLERLAVTLSLLRQAFGGEGGHTRVALSPAQVAQCLCSEVIVGGPARRATDVGDRVDPRRPTTASRGRRAVGRTVARRDPAVIEQSVQVPSDGPGGEPEPLGQRCGGGGTVLDQRLDDAITRGRVLVGYRSHSPGLGRRAVRGVGSPSRLGGSEFHDSIVT
jgi:hypothetical protein